MNLCMITGNDKVLVMKINKKDWKGISFPGGHIETSEPIVDSVIREVKEETGLTISDLQLCGIVDWCNEVGSRSIVFLYKTESFIGELQSSTEGEVWWEDFNNLKNISFTPDMDEYLKIYQDNNLSELYYRKNDDNWIKELK